MVTYEVSRCASFDVFQDRELVLQGGHSVGVLKNTHGYVC